MDPLISIIVPIYNSEKYLDRCINSILQQTYHNIEVILVNDGSTDNSMKICEYYKNIDSRVILINKENGGVSSARNVGLDIAKGEFVGFVDSDDYIDKLMYHKLYNCIKDNSDLAVLISYTINKTELMNKNILSLSGYEALGYIFKLEFPSSLWAYLYSKNAIKELRLNQDIHFFEDFEYNTKILKRCNKVNICKESLYNYEINENSINNQKINEKKITCLAIYDNIIKDLGIYKDHELLSMAEYFRTHFLISVVLSLSKSYKNADLKYFLLARNFAREILLNSLKSKYVPVKYKVVLLLTSLAPKFATLLIYLLKY